MDVSAAFDTVHHGRLASSRGLRQTEALLLLDFDNLLHRRETGYGYRLPLEHPQESSISPILFPSFLVLSLHNLPGGLQKKFEPAENCSMLGVDG
ncbi:hypothetical protein E4U57_006314, partial [Claviceps arundinis]